MRFVRVQPNSRVIPGTHWNRTFSATTMSTLVIQVPRKLSQSALGLFKGIAALRWGRSIVSLSRVMSLRGLWCVLIGPTFTYFQLVTLCAVPRQINIKETTNTNTSPGTSLNINDRNHNILYHIILHHIIKKKEAINI